jgi:hypothetical protein
MTKEVNPEVRLAISQKSSQQLLNEQLLLCWLVGRRLYFTQSIETLRSSSTVK